MKHKLLMILFFFAAIANCQNIPSVSNLNNITQSNTPANVLGFDYDGYGNQVVRKFIYVSSGIYKQTDNSICKPEELSKTIYDEIKYHPNPVVSELYLKWKNIDLNYIIEMELYSINGQLLKKINDLKYKKEEIINFQIYPSGYYILQIIYSNNEKKSLKIIKK